MMGHSRCWKCGMALSPYDNAHLCDPADVITTLWDAPVRPEPLYEDDFDYSRATPVDVYPILEVPVGIMEALIPKRCDACGEGNTFLAIDECGLMYRQCDSCGSELAGKFESKYNKDMVKKLKGLL